jgi:hypothetical protein
MRQVVELGSTPIKALWISVVYFVPRRYNDRTTEHYDPDMFSMNVPCGYFHHDLLGADTRRSREYSRPLTFAFGYAGPSP